MFHWAFILGDLVQDLNTLNFLAKSYVCSSHLETVSFRIWQLPKILTPKLMSLMISLKTAYEVPIIKLLGNFWNATGFDGAVQLIHKTRKLK